MHVDIVGIFVPVYHREDKVVESVKSLLATDALWTRGGLPERVSMRIMVGVNGASKSLTRFLARPDGLEKFRYKFGDYRLYKPPTNMGKPKIVNRMVEDMAAGTHMDYVLSYDSDMVARDPLWLLRMLEAYRSHPMWRDLGALSANQEGGCCHVLDKDPVRWEGGGYSYTSRAGNEGVAGGALLTPYHTWRAIGGYTGHRIYASDDGHYALECARRNLLMCVVNEVSLYHPPGDDREYIEWKHRALTDTLGEDELRGIWG